MKDFSEHCVEFSEALSAVMVLDSIPHGEECAKTLQAIAMVCQQTARRFAPGHREGDVEALHNATLETLLELNAVNEIPTQVAPALVRLFRETAETLETMAKYLEEQLADVAPGRN